jgi:flagellar hook protein FlgE
MASEFVTMIQNQRAYQANTRIVSVGDQLLQETVNMLR